MKQDFKKWFADKGDETLRIDYPLTKDSIVFDIGGYKGDWAAKINEKYGCQILIFEPVNSFYLDLVERFKDYKNVIIHDFALGSENELKKIKISNDASSFFTGNGVDEIVRIVDVSNYLENFDKIDLMKINIEGSEYPLLERMIGTNLHRKITDIQVQFHVFVDGFEEKYNNIKKELSKTHCTTYNYPFIWENFHNLIGSHSQVGQDLFVLSQFPSGYKGTFLDIGCSFPNNINNTILLEQKGWKGTSLDIQDYSKEWKSRNTKFVCADALKYEYSELPKQIDYLSLDIEGNGLRFAALKRVIDLGFEFKVITIEHDAYRGYDETERQPQRKLLLEKGYKLVAPNVHHNSCAFEDWWINSNY